MSNMPKSFLELWARALARPVPAWRLQLRPRPRPVARQEAQAPRLRPESGAAAQAAAHIARRAGKRAAR